MCLRRRKQVVQYIEQLSKHELTWKPMDDSVVEVETNGQSDDQNQSSIKVDTTFEEMRNKREDGKNKRTEKVSQKIRKEPNTASNVKISSNNVRALDVNPVKAKGDAEPKVTHRPTNSKPSESNHPEKHEGKKNNQANHHHKEPDKGSVRLKPNSEQNTAKGVKRGNESKQVPNKGGEKSKKPKANEKGRQQLDAKRPSDNRKVKK